MNSLDYLTTTNPCGQEREIYIVIRFEVKSMLFEIARLVFQIRANSETHCATYVVDVIPDRMLVTQSKLGQPYLGRLPESALSSGFCSIE